MNIKEFNKVIALDDLARPNLYSIQIYMPAGFKGIGTIPKTGFYNLADTVIGANGQLSYMAKAVSVPGKSIGTIDAKRFGPVFKVANDLIVDTVSMTFMLSEDWKEHKFFDGWLSGIMGSVAPGTGSTSGERTMYTVSYYQDYISQVEIIPLDRQGGVASIIVLHEAYPTNIGPVELAWGDSGEVATFTVTWSFRDWYHTGPDGWWAEPEGTPAEGSVMGDVKSQDIRRAGPQ